MNSGFQNPSHIVDFNYEHGWRESQGKTDVNSAVSFGLGVNLLDICF